MKRHLVRWHKDYAEKGLVVIDVDNGQVDPFDQLKKEIQKDRLHYPVLWDKAGRNFENYGVRSTPWALLIGSDGKVVWEGNPLPKVEELERGIQTELEKVRQAH
jgi:hypothetical protein